MILFSSLNGLNCFLLMLFCGCLIGVVYETGYFIRRLIPIKFITILVDAIFVLLSFLLFVFAINYCNFGEFRLFLLSSFLLGFVLERVSIGFLVAKILEFIYNCFVKKIIFRLKKLRGKYFGRRKVKKDC